VSKSDPASPSPAARAYHDATRHSWQSVRSGDHFLDWEIKPFPFKVYPDAPTVRLPREVRRPAQPALAALAGEPAGRGPGRESAPVDLERLAELLFFSAGLTKKKMYPGGESIHFRAAASTGALYETEIYVVAGALDGLEAGVYHFSPGDFTLRRLRSGDHRAALGEAASQPAAVAAAPATLVLTAIYWRNTWKYRARGFRHFFWNAGTLLANLLATAAGEGVPARVLLGFADGAVNALLGLDARQEGSLALVPLGAGAASPPPAPAVAPLALATLPLSSREVDYPLVREIYGATSLPDGEAARRWAVAAASAAAGDDAVSHALPRAADAPAVSLGDVILRRGSTRQFARESIDAGALGAMLDLAARPWPLDAGGDGAGLVDLYLLVHAVEGLPAGAYVHVPAGGGLHQLRPGEFRQEGGYLCLEQALGADASAVVFFLADLERALARHGDRGYRAVNLAAGLLGGRLYLAAYALGLGATGLTFYDDDVVRFFSPHAAGKDTIFVTALGRARRAAAASGLAPLAGKIRPMRPGDR
jgi:SagB-type dehydrogenase family enzyme